MRKVSALFYGQAVRRIITDLKKGETITPKNENREIL